MTKLLYRFAGLLGSGDLFNLVYPILGVLKHNPMMIIHCYGWTKPYFTIFWWMDQTYLPAIQGLTRVTRFGLFGDLHWRKLRRVASGQLWNLPDGHNLDSKLPNPFKLECMTFALKHFCWLWVGWRDTFQESGGLASWHDKIIMHCLTNLLVCHVVFEKARPRTYWFGEEQNSALLNIVYYICIFTLYLCIMCVYIMIYIYIYVCM